MATIVIRRLDDRGPAKWASASMAPAAAVDDAPARISVASTRRRNVFHQPRSTRLRRSHRASQTQASAVGLLGAALIVLLLAALL